MLELGSFFELWKIPLSPLQSSFLAAEDGLPFVFALVTEFMEAPGIGEHKELKKHVDHGDSSSIWHRMKLEEP